ncbi:hypothetical protein H0H93_010683 [Arthromyces matolae]|nr:hypothetical protein H0H93_010683 [Arthromyces matolae]
MPSLRRTISSPAVRSSPYPALSSSVSGGPTRPGGHRRSSGSETSTRRVLADIEWWRVTDGQRDPDADQESEDPNRDQAPDSPSANTYALEELLGTSLLFSTSLGAERSVIVPLAVTTQESQAPTSQFAALSISPQTPTRAGHTRNSSVESTPDAVQPDSFDGLRLSILDTETGTSELSGFPALQSRASLRSGLVSPLFTLSFGNDHVNHYADFTVSPLSAAPDLCN